MPSIVWSDMLATGADNIDSQHKQLLGIINDFIHGVVQGTDAQRMEGILQRLRAYTREHFGDEEDLMAEVGFPDLEAHKAEHARMLDEMETRLNAALANDSSAWDVRVFLKTWLVDHILGWDFKLIEHIKATDRG